jgi:hypothetical protein
VALLVGNRQIAVDFDQNVSYLKVLQALAEANMGWVAGRRTLLVAPTASRCVSGPCAVLKDSPSLSLTKWSMCKGKRRTGPSGLGPSGCEKVVCQVFTSDNGLKGVRSSGSYTSVGAPRTPRSTLKITAGCVTTGWTLGTTAPT